MIIGIDASRATRIKQTGTETYAYRVIAEMAKLADADHRLRLYTHQAPPQNWFASPFVETRVIPFPRLWTHIRLSAEVSAHPPAVLFVPAHVLPLHCPVPAVVTVHDLGYHHFPTAHTAFQRRYLDFTTRRHAHAATHIIADSAATKADLLRFYDADPHAVSVVHLGLDNELQPVKKPMPFLQKYGIHGDYLLYLGTLQPRKNIVRLLDAFQRVSQNHPDVTLVLAGGKGWLFDKIQSKIKNLNLGKRVILPGFIPKADKAALLSGAIAYLFPSLYEGFGLPVLEAMACGTPVLAANTSSLPEVAGSAAWFVSPTDTIAIADGIETLLTDTALRQKLVKKGFARAKQFSWQKTGAEIWEILIKAGQK